MLLHANNILFFGSFEGVAMKKNEVSLRLSVVVVVGRWVLFWLVK